MLSFLTDYSKYWNYYCISFQRHGILKDAFNNYKGHPDYYILKRGIDLLI
jgi:hypothetical protein